MQSGLIMMRSSFAAAREQASAQGLTNALFEAADCRTVNLEKEFDGGICLYDVVGTYVEQNENLKLLQNLVRHVRRGGFILLSVMNMEFTERRAKHWFSIGSDPDRLLKLSPSRMMETTGEIFNPEYYMIDEETRIVYRKEV
jgi:2-polyprenyl-3-methyl-5-hydroxy-6-metoxy-1,4-benzoquinol methylase